MDYYKILDVSPTADPDEIKQAFRRLARQYHPDLAGEGGRERFQQINEAYQVLSDPDRRRAFDQSYQPTLQDESTPRSTPSASRSTYSDPRVVIKPGPRHPTEAERRQIDKGISQIKKFLRDRKYTQALQTAEGLQQQFPTLSDAIHILALVYARVGNVLIQVGDHAKAEYYLRKALKTEPNNRELAFEVKHDLSRLPSLR